MVRSGVQNAENSLVLCHARTFEKTATYEPGSRCSADTGPAGALILDFTKCS